MLLARREERLAALAAELDAEWEVCDVGERQDVEAVARRVTARHPALSLLVNNAGVPGRAGFLTLDPDRIEAVLRTNYLGSVWCLRAFLPALEAAAPSDVVNVVSVAGSVAFPPSGPYSAAKHAQLAFSRAAAAELRPRGVHVHTVNPGFVETEGFPASELTGRRATSWLVSTDEKAAAAILDAGLNGRAELYVPRPWRLIPVLRTLTPGLLRRLGGGAVAKVTLTKTGADEAS